MRTATRPVLVLLLAALVSLTGCSGGGEESADTAAASRGAAPAEGVVTGTVTETMDAGGYTYVLVDTGAEQAWAAAPQFATEVGAEVSFTTEMPMRGYHSDTLDRTFDLVYFTSAIRPAGAAGGGSAANPHATGDGSDRSAAPSHGVDIGDIPKAEGGYTVAEIVERRNELEGEEVAVRGKVVKFNAAILGTNWLHIQDGSGEDLAITSQSEVPVGSTVLVRGAVSVDKDFGAGYSYEVIIQEADVVLETAGT